VGGGGAWGGGSGGEGADEEADDRRSMLAVRGRVYGEVCVQCEGGGMGKYACSEREWVLGGARHKAERR